MVIGKYIVFLDLSSLKYFQMKMNAYVWIRILLFSLSRLLFSLSRTLNIFDVPFESKDLARVYPFMTLSS